MNEKSVLTLCDILINRINLIKHNKAKQGLSLRKFSKDLIGCIERYNTDVQELLGDACGSLYGVPLKRRRLSSMERSDQEESSSEVTEEETSENCGVENEDSNLSDHNPVVTVTTVRRSEVTCTENNDNGVDNDNSKVMTVLEPAPKTRSRRLTIFSPRKTTPNTRLATTVAQNDTDDEIVKQAVGQLDVRWLPSPKTQAKRHRSCKFAADHKIKGKGLGMDKSSCSCPSVVVEGTQEGATQVNRYIGDHIPNIILLNSRHNIKQFDLLQLNPETIADITKRLN